MALLAFLFKANGTISKTMELIALLNYVQCCRISAISHMNSNIKAQDNNMII